MGRGLILLGTCLALVSCTTTRQLIKQLETGSKEQRVEAAQKLAEVKVERGKEAAVEALLAALTDPDPEVQAAAATSLGKIGDSRAVEPLLKVLEGKQWQGAIIQAYEGALAGAEVTADLYLALGRAYQQQGNHEKALENFKEALNLADQAQPCLDLAWELEQQKEWKLLFEALDQAEKYAAEDPSGRERILKQVEQRRGSARLAQIRAAFEDKKDQEAWQMAEDLYRTAKHPQTLVDLSREYRDREKRDRAVQCLDKARPLIDSDTSYVRYSLKQAYEDLGEPQKAAEVQKEIDAQAPTPSGGPSIFPGGTFEVK